MVTFAKLITSKTQKRSVPTRSEACFFPSPLFPTFMLVTVRTNDWQKKNLGYLTEARRMLMRVGLEPTPLSWPGICVKITLTWRHNQLGHLTEPCDWLVAWWEIWRMISIYRYRDYKNCQRFGSSPWLEVCWCWAEMRDVMWEIFRWGRSTKKPTSYGELVGTESTSKESQNRTVLLINANCRDAVENYHRAVLSVFYFLLEPWDLLMKIEFVTHHVSNRGHKRFLIKIVLDSLGYK